jgi:zinc/manganese transport system substrate-binding protein
MTAAVAHAATIRVVAAQSVYGGICRQIGGDRVEVVSILNNPNQDPHAFEAGAAVARDLAQARLVIYNGAGYDPWVTRLMAASKTPSRTAIEVARLAHRRVGDNPHVWYDPAAISALAGTLAATLARIDPAHRSEYAARHAAFEDSLQPLRQRIAAMRRQYAGVPVTATEPVFEYLADALGLVVRHRRFQLAIMNDTEPSARDIAAFERDLRTRAVRVLLFNTQTRGGIADRMRAIAASAGVPVVGISELEPPGTSYPQWMLAQLDALDRALGGGSR